MKNTYISIIILILLVSGVAVFLVAGKKAEAPLSSSSNETVDKMEENEQESAPKTQPPIIQLPPVTICTMDAKLCPDGSFVGRSGPKCEFSPCPEPRAPSSTVKEFSVSGKNFSFSPSVIKVKKGDQVRIIFKNENGFHDLKIDEFGAATKQTQSPTIEVLEFTANKLGTFEYYCSVGSHRTMGMKGSLIVE